MTRNYKSITLLLVAVAVLSFSSALYMYNDYRILDQNYQAMQGNIDDSSINIDLIVDFSMYNSTEFIIGEDNMDSTYYSEFNAYFVNSLLGTGDNPDFAWSAWQYQECCNWELLEISSNLYMPKDGQVIAWYYQDVDEFGRNNPN